MILKTEAIALNISPFSNSSHWVTWMTREHGKINTLIKGAQRPKSLFLGQYDLFYTCELLFYKRTDQTFKLARECTPLICRTEFRRNWSAAAAASYICYLADRCSPVDSSEHNLFDWLSSTLDLLASGHISEALLVALEFQFLHHLGLQPQLNRCRTCGKLVQQQQVRFSISQGSIFCTDCMSASIAPYIQLPADILAPLQAWQSNAGIRMARSTRPSAKQLAHIERFMNTFLQFHLDDPMTARIAAVKILKAA